MKGIKKWISLTLSALFVFGAASCASKEEQTPTAETDNVTTMSKVENEYRVELCNFEQWKPDFSLIHLMEAFGKVSRNKDKEYVKSGSYSAKLQPLGGYYSGDSAVMYYPFASTVYEFNYENFTYVDYIECWVYNDEETVQSMNMGLISDITSQTAIKKYPADIFYLQPKQWNLVTYYVDFAAMSTTQTLKENALMKIKGVYFEFNPIGSIEIEDAPVLYMDDLNIYYKETQNKDSIDLETLITFNHKEGTNVYNLCDFEYVYQKYIFTPKLNDAKAAPIFSIVEAESQNIDGFKATSGKHVLRIETMGTETGESTTQYKLSGEIVRAFYDKYFYDYDTGTDIIPVEEWGDYYFAFDVYAVDAYDDFSNGYTFGSATFRDGDEGVLYWTAAGAKVKQGEWVTMRVCLADIADEAKHRSLTTDSLKNLHAAYKAHYDANGGRGRRITDAGSINFYWPNFKATETLKSRVVYMDNIRVYKATT